MCSGDCTEFQTHLKAAATVIRNQDYDGAANKYYFEQRLAWYVKMIRNERPAYHLGLIL